MSKDEDLDLTGPRAPLPPPTAEKIADARKEASTGGPQLARSGFYVAMARHATGGPVPPRDGERHTILVVDDDYNLVKLVTEVLGMAGFDVRIARNGAGINHEINRTPLPDLMLLDVALPDADGFEILERIRADERIATLPVIMMTGKSEIADVARGLALSADGYVTKPFKMTALVAAVNTVLGLA